MAATAAVQGPPLKDTIPIPQPLLYKEVDAPFLPCGTCGVSVVASQASVVYTYFRLNQRICPHVFCSACSVTGCQKCESAIGLPAVPLVGSIQGCAACGRGSTVPLHMLCTLCIDAICVKALAIIAKFRQVNLYLHIQEYLTHHAIMPRTWFNRAGDSCHYGSRGLRELAMAAVARRLQEKHPGLVIHDNTLVQTLYNIVLVSARQDSAAVSFAHYSAEQQTSLIDAASRPDSQIILSIDTKTATVSTGASVATYKQALRLLTDAESDGMLPYETLARLNIPEHLMRELLETRHIVPMHGAKAAFARKPLPPPNPRLLPQWLAHLNSSTVPIKESMAPGSRPGKKAKPENN
jgi:hypothetical protein